MEALSILALFVFGGLLTYTMVERKHRHSWRLIERRPIERDPTRETAFRFDAGPAMTEPVLVQRRAPKIIRRTALWSLYMGQMSLPGGLLGLFGLFAAGIGLVSIPGMILAVRIWLLGGKLLRRDPGAEVEARKLASFATVLNIIGVAIALILLPFGGWEIAPLSLVLIAYALVSFAHANAMLRCAELLGEDRERRARAAAQAAPTPTPAYSQVNIGA